MLATIKKGSSGNIVRAAQYLIGYAPLKQASGEYDSDFATFVKNWQKKNQLDDDGIIGKNSWTLIAKSLPTCSKSKNKVSVYTNGLQELLNTIVADGEFGSKTKAAVKAFQSSANLEADGTCGVLTWTALIVGTSTPTPSGKFKQPVDYKQGDSRWGKNMYSNHNDKSQTMKNSGCGPTACADVVATLIDSSVTPWTLAQLSMKWGTRTTSNGTAWGFFKKVFEYYKGFSKFIQTSSIATAKACIDAGGYVVCSMAPPFWTKGGHFICMWKYENGYIYCNDPASSTRKRQIETDFVKQRKQFFCFYPSVKEGNADGTN